MNNFLIKFLATSGFVGFAPYAPGTFGTLVGVFIYLLFLKITQSQFIFLFFSIIYFIVSIFVSNRAEKLYGLKDCQRIVCDETSGFFFSILFIPCTIRNIIFAFLIFRIFDVVKPYPIRKLQNIRGGLGIMLDDLLAAVYTNIVLNLIRLL